VDLVSARPKMAERVRQSTRRREKRKRDCRTAFLLYTPARGDY
jgi:hypothetical protein